MATKKEKKIRMLENMILVNVVVDSEENGISLPEELVQQRRMSATVGIAEIVGPECKYVKKGDFIFYKQYVGNALEHEQLDKNSMHIVVSENDVLGII